MVSVRVLRCVRMHSLLVRCIPLRHILHGRPACILLPAQIRTTLAFLPQTATFCFPPWLARIFSSIGATTRRRIPWFCHRGSRLSVGSLLWSMPGQAQKRWPRPSPPFHPYHMTAEVRCCCYCPAYLAGYVVDKGFRIGG